MTAFVLDNSVAMRWHLESNQEDDQNYAEAVLFSLSEVDALVPNLWHLEAANVLFSAEKRDDSTIAEVERFTAQLENLPIQVDPLTSNYAISRIASISRAYNLSSYDASYLELAVREGLPLASLDKKLVKAAIEAKIELYLR